MDRLTRYRQVLKHLLMRHAEHPPSHGRIETLAICDTTSDNYLLLDAGWDLDRRVHAVAFHARVQDGKVWIEWDGTDPSLTEALVEAGIPPEDIVLAFYHPDHRPLTRFAVA